MKKFLVCLMALLLSLTVLAGCNFVPEDNKEENPDDLTIDYDAGPDYEGNLNIWIQSVDSEIKIMDAFVASFNEAYPKIKVTVTPVQNSTYLSKLKSEAASALILQKFDTMPDIFWVSPFELSSFYESDMLMNLQPISEEDDAFDPSTIIEGSISNSFLNGNLVMMPRDYNQVVMYYNKDMFDAAGVTYPPDDRQLTKDEFVQMLRDLQAGLKKSTEENQYGNAYCDVFTNPLDAEIRWDSMSWPLVKSYGGKIVDEQGSATDAEGNIYLNSQNVYNAMEFVSGLIDEGLLAPIGSKADSTQFLMETAPVYFHVRATLSSLVEQREDYLGIKNMGVAPFPQLGDEYFVGTGATGYSMYKYCVNPTPAWLFLRHIVTEEAQNKVSESGNIVPCNRNLFSDPNAAWRQYTHSSFKTGINHDAFIYKSEEVSTHVMDFLQYVEPDKQSSVIECLHSLYVDFTKEESAERKLKMQNQWAVQLKNYLES